MLKTISLFAGFTALFAMGSAQAEVACPTAVLKESNTNPDTGHFFEVYEAPGITWEAARSCAEGKTSMAYPEISGHLATITSSKEDVWVDSLRREAGLREVWVGGSQTVTSAADEPGNGWFWENGDGAIPTPQQPDLVGYSNWLNAATIEPNNLNGFEQHLAIGLGDAFGWNDESYLPNIQGFIVEYDLPRTASCDVSNTSCNTIDGQKLVFPAGSFDPEGDQSIGFTSFEFTDPRVDAGTCGTQPLTLFTTAQGFPAGVELRIPPYLCGSPKFVVVKVDSSELFIKEGAVEVFNNTQVVLPQNLYRCFDPQKYNLADPVVPAYSALPEQQDVVVWQSTNPSLMLEGPGSIVPERVLPDAGAQTGSVYRGTATEATNGCGSTTGKVRTGSYFVVGMHAEFNGGTDYANFFNLTKYKLDVLMQSVRSARAAGAVRNPDGQAMESQLKNAITAMNANNPASALASINKFLAKVQASQYLFPPTKPEVIKYNYQGDHLMRGENIQFTLRVKVIPFKP
jgi:hypothetical protein